MVAKKTTSKKPATKKTEKSVKSVKAVKSVKTTKPVVKEAMPATDKKCECGYLSSMRASISQSYRSY